MNTIDDRIIELQELRIGNLLEYKGETVKVTSLSCDIDDEYEDQICFVKLGTSSNEKGGWNRSLVNDLKRIPLTSELLERCGFEELPQGQYEDDGNWHLNVSNYIIAYDDRCQFSESNFSYNGCTIWRPIRHVHELQNLYRSLTGEELTIK